MAIFDLDKDALLQLSELQLEELVARLAEAELASLGHSPDRVYWGGSTKSPDGGVDVRVDVPVDGLDSGFLSRPNTIFQVKKHTMPKSSITKEMCLDGAISQQAAIGGSYVIVTPADDCTETMKQKRLNAMRRALDNDPNREDIHLDFIDRSRLHQWVRQHPAVMLRVRHALGQACSGWQPYGAWSKPPVGVDDSLILAPGVSITMPSNNGNTDRLSIEDAIEPMRNLVRSTNKAIRITGLSGVGKTKIVESLFDKRIPGDALDRTIAIYSDTGDSPDPTASAMLERLIAENRRAILVLDNCPSDIHSTLAQWVASSKSEVSLITVEYDIKDDRPQLTETIHIEAEGPDVAEQLLLQRFPDIGELNARKIAEFAGGNAKVSLAVAERVENGESLAHLSDAQLFSRLFEQRNQPDNSLRTHAEILSLVYSFSMLTPTEGIDELAILGSIHDVPRKKLFRSVSKLIRRHVAQQRAHWRAILPHAIANRLAGEALDNVPVETLRETFETQGRERLLMSFAHRLGLMHDHPKAKEIVESWLQKDGMLSQLSNLNETEVRILEYAAPAAPNTVLDRIEVEINTGNLNRMEAVHLHLLQSLAYNSKAFDRCVNLLLRFPDDTCSVVVRFFQPCLSGTHATLQQRLAIVRRALLSGNSKKRSIGFNALSKAIGGPPWIGVGMNDFGAHPRDCGFQPNHCELVEWRNQFIDLAVEMGVCSNPDLTGPARTMFAQAFRGLWRHQAIRGKLVEAARKLNSHEHWSEGFQKVRATIYFEYHSVNSDEDSVPIPEDLTALLVELAPPDLMARIRTYVLGKGYGDRVLDDEFDPDDPERRQADQRLKVKAEKLGEAFACTCQPISLLGSDIFSDTWMPYRRAFGKGLARGAMNHRATWRELVEALHRLDSEPFDYGILRGFIEEIDSQDRDAAQALLDQCLNDKLLRTALVELHPPESFGESDLNRCVEALACPEVNAWTYWWILWQKSYAGIPTKRLLDLAKRLRRKPNGDEVVLKALSMKLFQTDPEADTLGVEFRRIGLLAAVNRLQRNHKNRHDEVDHDMNLVVAAALSFDGNDKQKKALIDAIFLAVDKTSGHLYSFRHTIQTTASKAPDEFLKRIFAGNQDTQRKRMFFIKRRDMDKLPLGGITVDVLVDWCQRQTDPKVWPIIGSGIELWAISDSDNSVELNQMAIEFLEAAPDPDAILGEYSGRIMPNSCWGSLADEMQRRGDAIGVLRQHSNQKIAEAARSVMKDVSKRINVQRQREEQQTRDREQRFE